MASSVLTPALPAEPAEPSFLLGCVGGLLVSAAVAWAVCRLLLKL